MDGERRTESRTRNEREREKEDNKGAAAAAAEADGDDSGGDDQTDDGRVTVGRREQARTNEGTQARRRIREEEDADAGG